MYNNDFFLCQDIGARSPQRDPLMARGNVMRLVEDIGVFVNVLQEKSPSVHL